MVNKASLNLNDTLSPVPRTGLTHPPGSSGLMLSTLHIAVPSESSQE